MTGIKVYSIGVLENTLGVNRKGVEKVRLIFQVLKNWAITDRDYSTEVVSREGDGRFMRK
jgi:hypothetical protein